MACDCTYTSLFYFFALQYFCDCTDHFALWSFTVFGFHNTIFLRTGTMPNSLLYFHFQEYNVCNSHLITISCMNSWLNEWMNEWMTHHSYHWHWQNYNECSLFANCTNMGFKCLHYLVRRVSVPSVLHHLQSFIKSVLVLGVRQPDLLFWGGFW